MNLKIELGEFYEDYRKETLLFVDIEEKPLVCDVIKYICEICEIELRPALKERICLFANGIYIPEKQPSLVLKGVKNVLSLRRKLNVRKCANAASKPNYIIGPQSKERKHEKNYIDNVKTFTSSVDEFSQNNIGVMNIEIPITEKNYDFNGHAEFISNDEITHLNLQKLKRKKGKRKKSDNADMQQDHEKINSINIFSGSNYAADVVPNSMKDIIEKVSQNEKSLESSISCISLYPEQYIPPCLDDPNACKSTSKRKKSRNKDKCSSDLLFESFDSNGINSSNNNVYTYNNTEIIGFNKESECLLTPSIHPSIISSIDKPKYNTEHCKESQIDIENNELINEKFQVNDNLNETENYNNSSISFSSLPNSLKRKRKRKHHKRSRVMPCNEFSTQINQAMPKHNFEQKCKMLRIEDISDEKKNHIKFGSDEEETKLEKDCIITTCTPNSELQKILCITGNFSNQESPTCTTSVLCSNSYTSSVVKVHSVIPLTLQNCSKDPPSSSQYVDRSVDSVLFAHLLKLENSQEICVFKRKNLKPNLNSKHFISNYYLKPEPIHINNLPHSPPSPKIFNVKVNKDVSSHLNLCEELENSIYPHIYYRKKKAVDRSTNNGSVVLNKEVANKLNVHEENILGLPSSFTSGNSKSQRKSLPLLNSCYTSTNKELISDRETNDFCLNNSEINGDGFSFMGAKPKKVKEKKLYSSLGIILKSLRNSMQNITTDENVTNTINNLNLNQEETAAALVEELEPNIKHIPKSKNYNTEQVIIGDDCDNQEYSNSLVDDTVTDSGTVKSETIILDSHVTEAYLIVDQPQPVNITKTRENDNLNYFYKSCPILLTLPNEGDIIAAKVMTLDETYSPCFSNYRPAKVNSISGLTLSLLFLDEGEFTPDELRKYGITSSAKNGEITNIDWRDLKDVRLLFP